LPAASSADCPAPAPRQLGIVFAMVIIAVALYMLARNLLLT
jgi:hypothetical protein